MTEIAATYEKVKKNYRRYQSVRDKVYGKDFATITKYDSLPPVHPRSPYGGIQDGKQTKENSTRAKDTMAHRT